MAMKIAFMAIVPGADPDKHRSTLSTEFVDLVTQLVANMDQAIDKAKQLAEEGCGVIELCGGFGHSMTGRIADAVRGKAAVGSVRFDIHAALGKSSDEVFSG
ncbi:MAG: hypothetical protein KAW13_03770 [Dehalococcoidia bacterium]|nr:hypothetical protein [Dehalococcoidia bacterium]